jgi:hypothetical protein
MKIWKKFLEQKNYIQADIQRKILIDKEIIL